MKSIIKYINQIDFEYKSKYKSNMQAKTVMNTILNQNETN